MCPETLGPLTGEMIRAARALTRLSRQELATAAGVGLDTIKRLEEIRGAVRANAETIARITAAFRAKGVSLRHDADCSEVVVFHPAAPGEGGAAEFEPGGQGALHRITYISRATGPAGREAEVLETIRHEAGRRNARLAITGALWLADGFFLQSIEGPKSSLQALAGMIALDPRHTQPMVLEQSEVAERTFSGWLTCAPHVAAQLVGMPQLSYGISPEAALSLLRSLADSVPPGPGIER